MARKSVDLEDVPLPVGLTRDTRVAPEQPKRLRCHLPWWRDAAQALGAEPPAASGCRHAGLDLDGAERAVVEVATEISGRR